MNITRALHIQVLAGGAALCAIAFHEPCQAQVPFPRPGAASSSASRDTAKHDAAPGVSGQVSAPGAIQAPYPRLRKEKQPDGTPIELIFEGSPFYPWYEDANGFTVVREGRTYVYARRSSRGELLPDKNLIVGKVQPAKAGLIPGIRPSAEVIERARQAREATRKGGELPKISKPGKGPKGQYSFVVPGTLTPSEAVVGKDDPGASVPGAQGAKPARAREYRQPDGTTIKLVDRQGWFEDENGYPAVLRGNEYFYAVRNAKGEYTPIPGLSVGHADPAKSGLRKTAQPGTPTQPRP